MNAMNFSDNIVRLRRAKKITQEALADFVGVTKASVSKWETGQSMPDIMLLPLLASFFDVSVDELIGYKPQLSREQIQKLYLELSDDFSKKSFEDTMKKSRKLAKEYYSCYPFLFQVCSLWINHFMLAESGIEQQKILEETGRLCSHILEGCRDIGLCSDTTIVKAVVEMQLGRTAEVVEILEEIINPFRLAQQSDSILIQAYQLMGKTDKANSFSQISMFIHLLNLISGATHYLSVHSGNPEVCEETIRRVDGLMEIYQLEQLHPNASALFQYSAALFYCQQQLQQKALERLKKYVQTVRYLLTGDHLLQHGDHYFNCISEWYDQTLLGSNAPRDRKLILESGIQSLNHPAFLVFKGNEQYERMVASLEGMRSSMESF